MRRSLPTALLLLVVAASGAEAQLLDDTLVPRGRVRVQAHPWFGTWNTRYGVASDGTESEEPLGSDLTDPTGLALFPGTDVLVGYVQDVGGLAGYAPTLGPVDLLLFAKMSNLLDEEARDAASFLKDIAPLPGRNFSGGIRATF